MLTVQWLYHLSSAFEDLRMLSIRGYVRAATLRSVVPSSSGLQPHTVPTNARVCTTRFPTRLAARKAAARCVYVYTVALIDAVMPAPCQ